MNRPLRFTLNALTLAALLAAPALAGRGAGGPPHERFHGGFEGGFDSEAGERMAARHAERLTRALDLTEAQQATLETLQATFGDTVRPIFESMRTAREELETLLDAENPDPATVGSKAIAMHQSRTAMKSAHETFEEGIVAMLTETQRAQYEALRDARPERGRFGRHHPPASE